MEVKVEAKRVSIRDIARQAQVSVATVSRYINQSGYVDRDTGRLIEQAIQATGYTPSMAARSLKTHKSRIILLVVPDICNPFYSSMAKEVQGLVGSMGYVMALYDSKESTEEMQAVDLADQMYASGILLASINIRKEVIHKLQKGRCPVVGLNAYEEYPFDTVHVRGIMGTYLSTGHLIDMGHTAIGYAGGTPNSMIGRSRRKGFEKAMAEAGIAVDPQLIIEKGFSQNDGYECGLYLRSLANRPSAICCANDQIALGLISALHEGGLWVPGDISVTGMDNIPYAGLASPSLTTVSNDSAAFSKEGVRMLFERIDGEYKGAPREVVVGHELIIRASTARLDQVK